jgi:hypothetical protein
MLAVVYAHRVANLSNGALGLDIKEDVRIK